MLYSVVRVSAMVLLAVGELCAQAVPFVNTPLVPGTIAPGGPGFALTVNGSGFSTSSVVLWNGHIRSTVFVSNTQLRARIRSADIATASTATVTVTTPGAPRRISNPVLFPVTAAETAITVTDSMTSFSSTPTVVDVNGDGIPDLVSFDSSGGTVLVALGTGGGQFASPQTYPAGGTPVALVAGLFIGDGKPDLAVATTGGVMLLQNTGAGAFGPPRTVTTLYLTCLAAADFNGDGRLDLVGGYLGAPHALYVMLRNPGGGFAPPVPYIVNGPISVVAGDFNRDGVPDLAALNDDDSISVLLGYGNGTFQPQIVFSTGSSSDFPTGIIAADFNGDGNLDLARAAALYNAGMAVLLGKGDGTFQTPQIYFGSSYGLVAGDFNGDGKLDVAVGANASDAGILLGNGDGTFQPVEYYGYQGVIVPAFFPAVADFNQNGRLDLVLSTETTMQLLVQ